MRRISSFFSVIIRNDLSIKSDSVSHHISTALSPYLVKLVTFDIIPIVQFEVDTSAMWCSQQMFGFIDAACSCDLWQTCDKRWTQNETICVRNTADIRLKQLTSC